MKRCSLSRILVLAFVLAAAPAGALPVTVFWDGPIVGNGASLSQATANNASVAGVPIQSPPAGFVLLSGEGNVPTIQQALIPSTVLDGAEAFTSNWTVVNDTETSLQSLYLVFLHPGPPESVPITYDPSQVGLTLGANWVIFQVDVGANPVYYPAISLGNLAADANAAFPLLYALNPPQFANENRNFELGIPTWTVSFVSVPIPEPASGVLLLAGLLGIAARRRKR